MVTCLILSTLSTYCERLNSHEATIDLVAVNIRYNQCILVKEVPILAYICSHRVCNHTSYTCFLVTISQNCVKEMDTADRAEASKVVKVNLGE